MTKSTEKIWAIHYKELRVHEGRILGRKGDVIYCDLPDQNIRECRRIQSKNVYYSKEEADKALFMHILKRGGRQ